MVEVGGARNLKEIRKVTGNFGDPSGIALERKPCLGGRTSYQIEGFFACERAQEDVCKNIEERRVGDELSVTQLLKIARRTCDVSNVIIVRDRAQKGIELEIKRSIGGDRVKLVEQYYELAPFALEVLKSRANGIKRWRHL